MVSVARTREKCCCVCVRITMFVGDYRLVTDMYYGVGRDVELHLTDHRKTLKTINFKFTHACRKCELARRLVIIKATKLHQRNACNIGCWGGNLKWIFFTKYKRKGVGMDIFISCGVCLSDSDISILWLVPTRLPYILFYITYFRHRLGATIFVGI